MKYLLVVLVLFVQTSFSQESLYIVNCTTSWQNTNFSVGPNGTVIFIAKGAYSDGTGGYTSMTSWSTPDGRGSQGALNHLGYGYVTEDFPIGALVGKVGEDGEIFGVGSFSKRTLSDSGNIYLTVNDALNGFGDNSGSLAVQMIKSTTIDESLYIVDCTTSWQNTNFSIKPNETVIFIAKGAYSDGTGGFTSLTSWSTPDGRGSQGALNHQGNGFVTEDFPIGALIGKVGEDGEIFGVGSFSRKTLSESGNIYLTVNDALDGFGDNSGSLAVQMIKLSTDTSTSQSLPFYDDFTNGANSNWQIIGNNWSFTNGKAYSNVPTTYVDEFMNIGNGSWKNYTFEVDLEGTDGTDKHIRFRTQDNDNGYYVHMRGPIQYHDLEIGKIVAGQWTVISSDTFSVQNNVNYRLKVVLNGSSIKLYIDNNLKLEATDNTFSSGGISLVNHSGGYAPNNLIFDNVAVYTSTTGVYNNNVLPKEFYLGQNFPNPFNPTTTIIYQISELSSVSIIVYDILGKEIAELVNKEQVPGNYEVNFNATGLGSGIYFYTLQAGKFVETKKMLLLK